MHEKGEKVSKSSKSNVKQEKRYEQNKVFLEKIRSIRKNSEYGKRQGRFFEHYNLDKYIVNELNSDSGRDDYMKKLENGIIDFPASLLPVYAEIGNCTIDDLLNDDIKEVSINKDFQFSDLCDMIKFLHKKDIIIIDKVEVENSTPRFTGDSYNEYTIRFHHSKKGIDGGQYEYSLDKINMTLDKFLGNLYELNKIGKDTIPAEFREDIIESQYQRAKEIIETEEKFLSRLSNDILNDL